MVVQQSTTYIDNETIKLSKCLLKKCRFIGSFKENRFVQQLNAYRQIVTINNNETDFINNLNVVKKRIEDAVLRKVWIGITLPNTLGAPVGHNLWISLNEQVFGTYVFEVRSIKYLENEVRLSLEIIKPYEDRNEESREISLQEDRSLDVSEIFSNITDNVQDIGKQILSQVTKENISNTARFLSVLVITIGTCLVQSIVYMMEYFLRFLKVFNQLVHEFYPYAELVFKFFAFIFMNIFALFRNTPKQGPTFQPYQRPVYLSNYNVRALPAPPNRPSGVRIREIY